MSGVHLSFYSLKPGQLGGLTPCFHSTLAPHLASLPAFPSHPGPMLEQVLWERTTTGVHICTQVTAASVTPDTCWAFAGCPGLEPPRPFVGYWLPWGLGWQWLGLVAVASGMPWLMAASQWGLGPEAEAGLCTPAQIAWPSEPCRPH